MCILHASSTINSLIEPVKPLLALQCSSSSIEVNNSPPSHLASPHLLHGLRELVDGENCVYGLQKASLGELQCPITVAHVTNKCSLDSEVPMNEEAGI